MTPISTLPIRRSLAPLAAALALAVGAPAAAAAGTVEVRWLQPEQYSDAGRSSFDREQTLRSLGDFMAGLGRQLPADRTLQIEVLDLDLAGELRHGRWNELRVLTGGADWPRLHLRYSLQEGGQTLQSGEARLSNMNYLFLGRGLAPRDTTLAHEKRMIAHWFGETFADR